MRYNIEIEVDEKTVQETEMEPHEYIRQEMGWLEDSGITLMDVTAKEGFVDIPSVLKNMTSKEALDYLGNLTQESNEAAEGSLAAAGKVNLSALDCSSEYRSGVEWHFTKDADSAVTAYVADKVSGEPLIEIREIKDTSIVWGEYALHIRGDEPLFFDNLDEAVDAANAYIYGLEGEEAERYPIHDLTGHEGIFHAGEADGKQYIINAFWSDVEPGYVNDGVFALDEDGNLEILTSEFCNGYLTTEDCVRALVDEHVPIENPTILFVAHCTHEFDTADEYREALGEGWLEEPVRISLHDLISEKEHIMSNEHQENKGTVLYKGIELENLSKPVSMAHSRFIGTNEGTDYLTALLNRDKKTLTPEQFKAMSALSSVGNMNYQICNGGLDQYYFNTMDLKREPFNDQDVAHLDKDAQVEMLHTLLEFGKEVYPEREEDNEKLAEIIQAFDRSYYDVTSEEDFEEGCVFLDTVVHSRADFDERYYEVNDYLENLMEAYAQYLDKSIEKELARDGKETFYFSMGSSPTFPYQMPGWVEVQAADRMEACELFSSHFPRRDGLVNCSFVYSTDEWKRAGMDEGKPGQVCRQVITDWGPHSHEKPLGDVMKEAGLRATDKNTERPAQLKQRRHDHER